MLWLLFAAEHMEHTAYASDTRHYQSHCQHIRICSPMFTSL